MTNDKIQIANCKYPQVANILKAEYKRWQNSPPLTREEGRLQEVEFIAGCLGINIYRDDNEDA